ILDIKSDTKGMLAPRMTTLQRIAIGLPAVGLLVYDITTNGFWYYTGSAWSSLSSSEVPGWQLTGNNITNPATDFIGTSDDQPLRFRTNNIWSGEFNGASKNYFIGDSTG